MTNKAISPREYFKKRVESARRVVFKLGSKVVSENGGPDLNMMREVCKALAESEKQVLLVSSGAIVNGREILGISEGELPLSLQQACASVGQIALVRHYYEFFALNGRKASQILVTERDFEDPESLDNLKRCIEELLSLRVVPIINENDAVSVAELSYRRGIFGDNDVLSALVAKNLGADILFILTDVDGIIFENGEVAEMLEADSLALESLAGLSLKGRGGIETKIRAAKMASSSNIPCVISNGKKKGAVRRLLSGNLEGTLIL